MSYRISLAKINELIEAHNALLAEVGLFDKMVENFERATEAANAKFSSDAPLLEVANELPNALKGVEKKIPERMKAIAQFLQETKDNILKQTSLTLEEYASISKHYTNEDDNILDLAKTSAGKIGSNAKQSINHLGATVQSGLVKFLVNSPDPTFKIIANISDNENLKKVTSSNDTVVGFQSPLYKALTLAGKIDGLDKTSTKEDLTNAKLSNAIVKGYDNATDVTHILKRDLENADINPDAWDNVFQSSDNGINASTSESNSN